MSLIVHNRMTTASPAEPQPARHARIGYRTWTRGLTLADTDWTSAADGFPADAPLHPDTGERWKPTGDGHSWQVDFGEARISNYVGIAAHNAATLRAAIRVDYWQDGVWNLFAETAPMDDSAIMFVGDDTFARWWLITVSKQVEIGVVYIGPVLEMTRPIYGGHSPGVLSRQTVLTNSLSRQGQFLGQQYRRKGLATEASFQHLKPDWYRKKFDPFVQEARRYPFFFSWRPTDYSAEVMYAWCPDDIQPSNMGVADFMEVSFRMVGFDD